MIKKFKVGKWYRYNIEAGLPSQMMFGNMEEMCDGKARKCLYVTKHRSEASFIRGANEWGYELENWEQVPNPKKRIDLTKPQIVKKDVLIEVFLCGEWVKRYLFIVRNNCARVWNDGKTGKENGFRMSSTTTWERFRHIEEPTPEPKKVTIELTEEQAEKVKKDLGLGENNG